ncbi:transporter substrate-binding domain-containing protein [Catenovulum sp. 2E275]|uniref:transporter substrate-binding domain-containing protein n=1 Tax=Catenovulum sp. 2E275 TaxID=2980497 RepID=UPI0021D36151|nr:transporter substrate-binding domain-containing protein [Catenovulum sp. 2E275]MCU4674010.1 transporter substrate-binding domain-containing protein [Catenovulum sp. 2E275]
MKSIKHFVVACCLLSLPAFVLHAETIRHNTINSAKEEYQLSLLKLALSYSDTQYEFKAEPEYLTQTKLLNDLEQDNIDIAWVGTSKEYEDKFLPIRVPLFKGLLGHRIFLIRQGEQAKFDRISSLHQLAQLKAGQVSSWVDAEILKQAGLNVVGTTKYENLFYMLEGGRFDYLPRSVYSPWAEMDAHPGLPLQVEAKLMIVYPLPAYFFVNKNNTKLYKAIETGLYKAIESGEFDQFFYQHPLIQSGLSKSKIKDRVVLKVQNPLLSDETPLEDNRLWFSVDNLE